MIVNNAGLLTWDYQTTKQGFELATGVKCVAFQSIIDGHPRLILLVTSGIFCSLSNYCRS